MKILNLIQCLNLGGMEQSLYILTKESQGKTISWYVQSITPAGVGREILTNLNIPVSDNSYEGKFGYKSYLELRKKVNNFSGDLILVNGPTLIGCLSIKSHPCKKILAIHFCHGSSFFNRLKWKVFYLLFHNDYKAIIYHSPYILEEAKEIAPQLQDKFHLIDNSTERCSPTTVQERDESRQALGISSQAFVIGNAGWLIHRKRFDIFLQVCAQLSKVHQNLVFLIAGDGLLREQLEVLAAELGITANVKFIGWQQDLNNFYQSLDLLLFNSDSDAFGRTVMEAMGYGIPVIASVLEGGTNAILIHEKNGYLIGKHDIDQLTKYCLKLIDNQNGIYEEFKSQALATIKERFTNEKFVQKYLDIFLKVTAS